MSFRSVFIAVVIATGLIVAAFILHALRPDVEVRQPTPELVRASGKCASCHREETGAIVAEFERSRHARTGVNCLDCHRPLEGQDSLEHRGFTLAGTVTSKNCQECHADQYRQFVRSRHAAPSFAAVRGREPFTEEQIAFAEGYHPGAVDRDPNALAELEGEAAMTVGCESCHSIGKPNDDGSIGMCTKCHARHQTSIALAREPRTCGQCHLGPDHSQIEIYEQSKHGAIFTALKHTMNLSAPPDELTPRDMPVPTCSTCHMSGLGDRGFTHDVTQRLSWYLFAPISEKRPGYRAGQDAMQAICTNCHTQRQIDTFYADAEAVVEATNRRVDEARALMDSLRAEGHLTAAPFDESLEFIYFDYWHYFGRTAKHGAFMGGPDYVQWHGNYELLKELVEMREIARELRSGAGAAHDD